MVEATTQAIPTLSPIKIPAQLIEAGAKFIKVKWRGKAAFEIGWERKTYSHNDPSLAEWMGKNNGNYGVVSHGIGTIDIDDMELFKSLGLEIPDSYTDCREGCRFHVYFKINILPEVRKATKFNPVVKWGDIRFPGHNSYVVGTGCYAPNHNNELKQYERFNDAPVRFIEWSVFQNIIDKSAGNTIDNVTLENVATKPIVEPLVITDKMHHQDIRRYVGNQVRLNVPLVAISAAVSAMNKKGLFNRVRGDIELSAEVDSAWDWHMRAKAKREAEKPKEKKPLKVGLAEHSNSEVMFAEEFVDYLDGNYLYNISTKQWHVWNGICWEVDERALIMNQAEDFAKKLFRKTSELDPDDVGAYVRAVLKINTKIGLNNIVTIASYRLTKTVDDFDTDEHMLNVKNGTLIFDKGTVTLKDHDKNNMCSLVCNCNYDPSVGIPELWLKHITTISGGDEDMKRNIQEILGYILDGGNPNEHFLILHGEGRNGKSVTMRTIMHIFGNYGLYVNPLTLMETGNNTYSPERLLMIGKRLIVAQEPNKTNEDSHKKDNTCLDSSFIKTASGHDVITARKIHSNEIKHIRVNGMITFCTNPLPKVNDDSVAFWERILTIPFRHIIPGWERDPTMEERLKEVSTGILNWLVEGYVSRGTGRFKLCQSILDDISEYRITIDEYAGFCHKCVEDVFDGVVQPNTLYDAYCAYQNSVGIVAKPKETFLTQMGKRYNKKHTMNGNVYTQIRLQGNQKTLA